MKYYESKNHPLPPSPPPKRLIREDIHIGCWLKKYFKKRFCRKPDNQSKFATKYGQILDESKKDGFYK